ncbi:NADH dehydrogenase [ubiquinone] 1 beta subcomplex subunit 2, mitochondrial [Halyomorpha halys]|uniref:NADH dehydrogenase [ubiquinone] 1 beta subcomplex subunit 2, mitochondrial n=1 Tax=Halyomorpha halys TaxID=286706 RepID=UPI0006D4DAD0|nr:NADH dehydrogenase [ubiquinone] 1 beta subcomplex subunit 2, mitochondrial [Halyomorpha halys]
MSLSRGINLFKTVNSLKKPIYGHLMQQSRNSGGLYSYRCGAYPPSKLSIVGANVLQGFMWWWVLWHLWHESDHITGEFPWPDTSKYTDEELGIPPDDE